MKWCRLVVAWQAREGEDRKKGRKEAVLQRKRIWGELGEKQGQKQGTTMENLRKSYEKIERPSST